MGGMVWEYPRLSRFAWKVVLREPVRQRFQNSTSVRIDSEFSRNHFAKVEKQQVFRVRFFASEGIKDRPVAIAGLKCGSTICTY